VLVVGEVRDALSGLSDVRIRIAASRINPGDIKKRQDSFGYGMPYSSRHSTAIAPGRRAAEFTLG